MNRRILVSQAWTDFLPAKFSLLFQSARRTARVRVEYRGPSHTRYTRILDLKPYIDTQNTELSHCQTETASVTAWGPTWNPRVRVLLSLRLSQCRHVATGMTVIALSLCAGAANNCCAGAANHKSLPRAASKLCEPLSSTGTCATPAASVALPWHNHVTMYNCVWLFNLKLSYVSVTI